MKSTERLEELLDQKDGRIKELESELEKYHEAEEREEWAWTIHREVENPEKLPVPRLEIRCVQQGDNWHNWTWQYALIYKHTLGHLVAVPMGETRVQGSAGRPPIFGNRIDTPFRDGVHICNEADQLKLPAFAICDGKIAKVMMKDGKCHQEPL